MGRCSPTVATSPTVAVLVTLWVPFGPVGHPMLHSPVGPPDLTQGRRLWPADQFPTLPQRQRCPVFVHARVNALQLGFISTRFWVLHLLPRNVPPPCSIANAGRSRLVFKARGLSTRRRVGPCRLRTHPRVGRAERDTRLAITHTSAERGRHGARPRPRPRLRRPGRTCRDCRPGPSRRRSRLCRGSLGQALVLLDSLGGGGGARRFRFVPLLRGRSVGGSSPSPRPRMTQHGSSGRRASTQVAAARGSRRRLRRHGTRRRRASLPSTLWLPPGGAGSTGRLPGSRFAGAAASLLPAPRPRRLHPPAPLLRHWLPRRNALPRRRLGLTVDRWARPGRGRHVALFRSP